MKMSERTRPYTEKPRVPWGLLACLVFFINLPFAFFWILKFADEIDTAKLNLEIMGWILFGSVTLLIFAPVICRFRVKIQGWWLRIRELPNMQD